MSRAGLERKTFRLWDWRANQLSHGGFGTELTQHMNKLKEGISNKFLNTELQINFLYQNFQQYFWQLQKKVEWILFESKKGFAKLKLKHPKGRWKYFQGIEYWKPSFNSKLVDATTVVRPRISADIALRKWALVESIFATS